MMHDGGTTVTYQPLGHAHHKGQLRRSPRSGAKGVCRPERFMNGTEMPTRDTRYLHVGRSSRGRHG